jgi:hypothetical protein
VFLQVVIILMAVGAGYLFHASGVLRRVRKTGRATEWVHLIIYTGPGDIRTMQCMRVDTGLRAKDGTIYPIGLVDGVFPFQSVTPLELAGKRVYFMAADKVALATHEALELGRETIDYSALYGGGGDLKGLLEMATLVVPLVVSMWFWLSYSATQTQIGQVLNTVNELKEVLPK